MPSDSKKEIEDGNDHEGKSSVFFNVMNVTNNIVGSGIITIPLAIRDSGVGIGIILLVISSLFCGWTLVAIPMCAELSKTRSYETMVRKVLGKYSAYVLAICTFFFPLTGAMAYGIAIVDNLSLFFGFVAPSVNFLQVRAVVAAIPLFIIILPLSLLRSLDFLDKFSSISILLVLFYLTTIVIRTATLPAITLISRNMWDFALPNAMKALPVFAFACSCHHNAVSLYNSLKDKSILKFQKVKLMTILISTCMYIVVGLCGYISFGGYPQGNIFNNYCTQDLLIAVTRIVFALTLMLTAPMQIYGARQVIVNTFLGRWAHHKWIRPAVTIILVLICYVIASTVRSLSIVVELGSALTAVPNVYIIPALCAIKLYGAPYYPHDFKTCFAWIILMFGIIMLVSSPAFTIMDAIKGDGSMNTPKYYCPLTPLY